MFSAPRPAPIAAAGEMIIAVLTGWEGRTAPLTRDTGSGCLPLTHILGIVAIPLSPCPASWKVCSCTFVWAAEPVRERHTRFCEWSDQKQTQTPICWHSNKSSMSVYERHKNTCFTSAKFCLCILYVMSIANINSLLIYSSSSVTTYWFSMWLDNNFVLS